ncbi:MAG TPA: aminotransferase class I/II-fold pyridoxal phosphate-dependent enzyme [Kineosporiaceae bacterium]|nr:aminotransferase class I/II-fold pyridoxal phosphate-dependent enzyme [Kineosporiaceae bacterium]
MTGQRSSEIAASIESQIADGRIPPGSRLPTVRELAGQLAVSPATVAGAYRMLAARGLTTGRGRAGTTVASRRSWTARQAPAPPPGVLDLASGGPDPALLPDLRPALAAVATDLAADRGRSRPYGADAGLPQLRGLLARRIAAEGGPPTQTGEVEVVGGVLDGMERVLSGWLRPGDVVAVEDPAYSGVLDLLDVLGLVPVGVPVDPEGPLPDGLDQALRGGTGPAAAAVVITVRAQNPTGACLTPARARDLATVLARYPRTLLVEDDHLGPVSGVPLASVAARARPQSWAHLHGVAKLLGPDLRLAGLAADPVTAARVRARQQAGPGWTSWLLQRLAVHLLTDRGHPEVVATAAAAYAGRREALADALEQRGIRVTPGHGLTLWVPVPQEAAVAQAALASGVAVRPGEGYRLRSGPGIRLSTATLDTSLAGPAADILAEAISGRRTPGTP